MCSVILKSYDRSGNSGNLIIIMSDYVRKYVLINISIEKPEH